MIRTVDYAAPIIDIQRRIELLRTFYVRHGLAIGLPWLVLWIPFATLLFGLIGVDFGPILWAARPWLLANVVFALAALIVGWAIHRWSRHPSRTSVAARIDTSLEGASLGRSRRFLEQLAAFERE